MTSSIGSKMLTRASRKHARRGEPTIAMPHYKVPRIYPRGVHHRPVQLEMWMESQLRKLHAISRGSTRDLGRHLVTSGELPVLRREELQPLSTAPLGDVQVDRPPRPEEGPQQRVGRRELQQRVEQHGALPGADAAHAQPALVHPEDAARAEAVVQVVCGVDARAAVPGVVLVLPLALEHGVVHAAPAVALAHPPLHAAAVHVRAQREGRVARLADPQPVGVREGLRDGDEGAGVRQRPCRLHQGLLHLHEVGVRPGVELWR